MPRDRQTGGNFLSTATLLQPKRPPRPDEAIAIREVHDLAERFASGMTTTDEIRAATSGKQRWLATRFTEPKDAAFGPLMAMLDALIADEGRFRTKHGDFDPEDLFAAQAKIVRDDGRELVQFPVLSPWRVKPDAEKGTAGIPNPPVYRRSDEHGPMYGSFSVKPPPQRKAYQPEWWELDETSDVPTPITAKGDVPF